MTITTATTIVKLKNPDELALMLPIYSEIISHTVKRIKKDIFRFYTIHIIIGSNYEEFTIYEDDPRYQQIDDHLGSENPFKGEHHDRIFTRTNQTN